MKKANILGVILLVTLLSSAYLMLSGVMHPRKVSCISSLGRQVSEADVIQEIYINEKGQYSSATQFCEFKSRIDPTPVKGSHYIALPNEITIKVNTSEKYVPVIGASNLNNECELPEDTYFLFIHKKDINPFYENGQLICRISYLVPGSKKDSIASNID